MTALKPRPWAAAWRTGLCSALAALAVTASHGPAALAVGAAAATVSFVTLGTGGGPVTRLDRAEPANAVIVGDAVYLFDAGDGVQRDLVRAGLPLKHLRAIFISHSHIDHIGGAPPLLVTRWVLGGYAPLQVIGPPGSVSFIKDLVAAFHVTELAPITEGGPVTPPLAASIAARDLPWNPPTDQPIYQDENIRVFAAANDHYHFASGSPEQLASRSYAFRIEAPGRTIVYTGDTGPSENVTRLAAGADLLVSEVIDLDAIGAKLRKAGLPSTVLEGKMAHMRQDHLTPAAVGELAAAAGVKEVVLTHLVPGEDAETSTDGYVEGIAARFKGPVHVARDGDRF